MSLYPVYKYTCKRKKENYIQYVEPPISDSLDTNNVPLIDFAIEIVQFQSPRYRYRQPPISGQQTEHMPPKKKWLYKIASKDRQGLKPRVKNVRSASRF